MPPTAYRRCLISITALFGSVLLLWAVVTPGFRAPDEPQHLNSVMRLATRGGWPAPGDALVADGVVVAAREAGFVRPDQGLGIFGASLLPRGTLEGWGLEFTGIQPVPRADRSVVDYTSDLLPNLDSSIDQMTQHPPLAYALGALTVRATASLDWRWDEQLLLLRVLSCLITVWSVPLVAATARVLGGSRTLAIAAAILVIGIGQLAHIGASVSNDALAIVLGLAATWTAASALRRPHGWRLPLLAGTILGLGLLTKGTLLAAIPMVGLAFLVRTPANPGAGRRWLSSALVMGTALVVGGWWWLRNLLLFHAIQPSGMPATNVTWGDTSPTLVEFLDEALVRLSGSFWGKFGWLEVPLPAWLTTTASLLTIALVVAALVQRSRLRGGLLVLLVFPTGVLGVVLLGAWQAFSETGLFPGLQGRYAFPTLAATLTAAAAGLVLLVRRWLRPLLALVPTALLVAATASAAFSLAWFFQAVYRRYGDPLTLALARWELWSTPPRPVLGILALVPVALAALSVIVCIRAARTFDAADVDVVVGVVPETSSEPPTLGQASSFSNGSR